MGLSCTAGEHIDENQCRLKNHPAVWGMLSKYENETVPDIEQCTFQNNTCVSNEEGPSLLCILPYEACRREEGDKEPDSTQMCSKNLKCGTCQGICQTNEDCKDGLECTKLKSIEEGIPGCSLTATLAKNIAIGYGYCHKPASGDKSMSSGVLGAIISGGILALALVIGVAAMCYFGKCNDWREKFNLKPRAGFSEVPTFQM